MNKPFILNLDGGKYGIVNDNGVLSFYRYGQPWRAADDLKHSGVVLSLVQRAESLDEALVEADADLANAIQDLRTWSQQLVLNSAKRAPEAALRMSERADQLEAHLTKRRKAAGR